MSYIFFKSFETKIVYRKYKPKIRLSKKKLVKRNGVVDVWTMLIVV